MLAIAHRRVTSATRCYGFLDSRASSHSPSHVRRALRDRRDGARRVRRSRADVAALRARRHERSPTAQAWREHHQNADVQLHAVRTRRLLRGGRRGAVTRGRRHLSRWLRFHGVCARGEELRGKLLLGAVASRGQRRLRARAPGALLPSGVAERTVRWMSARETSFTARWRSEARCRTPRDRTSSAGQGRHPHRRPRPRSFEHQAPRRRTGPRRTWAPA